MDAPSRSDVFRQRLNLKMYLHELGVLTGRSVRADELGTIEQAAALRVAAKRLLEQPSIRFGIKFSDRLSDRFKRFLQSLMETNRSPIYVWTPRTIDCGALLVPALDAIRFDFDFTINKEGILVFATSDFNDRLLLDFSCTHSGDQVMEVEIQGSNWARAVY
jgi:hypothetical protein